MPKVIFTILFFLSLSFSQELYLFRAKAIQMKALASDQWEQLGNSPFFISSKKPSFAQSLSKNKQYKVQKLWYTDKIQIEKAQQITRGNSNTIIGIIDTGTDLKNERLMTHTWINSAEDINQNGRLDSLDINGIDDDGNGYVDDVMGYDFVDTPVHEETRDFQSADPFPQDEFEPTGHGTLIHSQLMDFAPNVQLMILRAADANGLLEEDDIARAIVYALENKVDVLNLSFGNFSYSAFLEDLINYATARGVTFVAASGNDGQAELIYPARFASVISVGNSTSFDTRNASSNYSSDLDLLAPGTSIDLLGLNGISFSVSGTSFSAPFVSGTAALILDRFPDFSSEQIRQQLQLSADDILSEGFDIQSGAGRLNAFRAVSEFSHNELLIHSPYSGSVLKLAEIPIVISARGTHINELSLEVKSESQIVYSENFSHKIFSHDTLSKLQLSNLSDDRYEIELVSTLFDGRELRASSHFSIDRKNPSLNYYFFDQVIKENKKLAYLELEADEECRLNLFDRDGTLIVAQEQFSKKHFLTIDLNLIATLDSLSIHVFDRAANQLVFKEKIPSDLGYYEEALEFQRDKIKEKRALISEVKTDLNQNGKMEYWLFTYANAQAIDSLFIFEMNGSTPQFLKKMETDLFLRDISGDRLLFSYAGRSEVWQADANFNFSKLSTNSDGLAARFLDLAGKRHVLLRKSQSFSLFDEAMSEELASFTNPASDATFLGIPRIEILQSNDSTLLFYADANANIVSYLQTGSSGFQFHALAKSRYHNGVHSLKLIGNNLYHLSDEISQSLSQDDSYTSGRRILTKYDPRSLLAMDSLVFVDEKAEADNSFITTVQISGVEFIAVNISGRLFILDKNLRPFYKVDGFDSYSLAVDSNQFIVNQDDGVYQIHFGQSDAILLDQISLTQPYDDSLRFGYATSADITLSRIFISVGTADFVKIDSTQEKIASLFYPLTEQKDSLQFALQFLNGTKLSQLFKSAKLIYRKKPKIISHTLYEGRVLELNFDREMDFTSLQNKLVLNYGQIESIFSSQGKRLSVFYRTERNDSLKLVSLQDQFARQMKDTVIFLPYSSSPQSQGIVSYQLKNSSQVDVLFKKALSNSVLLSDLEGKSSPTYSINGKILRIENSNRFRYAEHYQYKITLANEDFYIGFTASEKITETILFPNPFIVSEHEYLSITEIPAFSKLSIFTFAGRRIFSRNFTQKVEHFRLNFKEEIAYTPASGIYFFVIESSSKTQRGKFTIIR